MHVELDPRVICNMVELQLTQCQHLQPLLDEALAFMKDQGWECDIYHVFHKANRCH